MNEADLQEKATPIVSGVYLHVPFCATTCDFCAFYQEKPDPSRLRLYLDGVEREMANFDWPSSLTTCFWGGGTPGVLSAAHLKQLCRLFSAHFKYPPQEWTVELDPTTVTIEKLEVLLAAGVNRLSIGAQSFSREQLQRLGRKHAPEAAERAVRLARAVGFCNINLDLMFAYPGQSCADWLQDIDRALALEPDHVSTYCLTLEEDTALYVRLAQEGKRLDPETEETLYLAGWEHLEKAGYRQYEISNFAREGFGCLHNRRTWQMSDWIGFGPSASSQINDRRWSNIDSLEQWHAGLVAGTPCYREQQRIDSFVRWVDTIVFGLRMNEGVVWRQRSAHIPAVCLAVVEEHFKQLAAEGLVHFPTNERVALTLEGRLVADAVGVSVLELTDSFAATELS